MSVILVHLYTNKYNYRNNVTHQVVNIKRASD